MTRDNIKAIAKEVFNAEWNRQKYFPTQVTLDEAVDLFTDKKYEVYGAECMESMAEEDVRVVCAYWAGMYNRIF